MGPMAQLSPVMGTEAEAAYDAAQRVVETHRRLARWLRPGMTLAQIDVEVARVLEELGCRSCFLGYRVAKSPAFPSHACLSVNDCVVHGTAGYYPTPLRAGDVLKIDIGVFYKGWVGDAAWTYLFAPVSPEVSRLAECGKLALAEGVKELRPGHTYSHWARRVHDIVERQYSLHLVRGLGGHGYGRKLHQPPFVSNVPMSAWEWPDRDRPCEPGTLLAVEPMIAIGTSKVVQKGREWPVFTADGSCSVHYEHDVLITESGPRVLTEGLQDVPDVIT